MKRAFVEVLFAAVIVSYAVEAVRADRPQTAYTLPEQVQWQEDKGAGVPPGSFFAVLHGKESDACGQVYLIKFPDGFVYPWHVNNVDGLYTVLKGTLVIGFGKNHAESGERLLPTGSFVDGLATEPHYGRAVGETIFEVVMPCPPPR